LIKANKLNKNSKIVVKNKAGNQSTNRDRYQTIQPQMIVP